MPVRPSRRSVVAAAATLPLAGALSSCSGGSGRRDSGRTTRITFWSALRGSQEVVDEFNRSQDRIRVDFQQIPSGNQGGYAKLSSAARAGNAPDVATIEYPQIPSFAIDGVARDITDLVDGPLREKILPQALNQTTFDGRVYSIPLDIEPMVLHYRTDLFDTHDLRVPRTWEEFEETAHLVRRKAPNARMALMPTDGAMQLAAFSWQAGGEWFGLGDDAWQVSLTDAPSRQVAEYWQRLFDQELVFMNARESQQADAQIGGDRVFTRLSGAWDAGAQMNSQPGQSGTWRIAPIPRWEKDTPATGAHGGSTFAVTSDSRHPEAAMEFIAWQVSHPDALRARLSSGISSQYPVVPELVAVGREAFDSSYYGGQDIYGLFEEETEHIRAGWHWGPRMSATGQVIHDALARVSGGRGTITDALRAGHDSTVTDLKALGLSVQEIPE